MNEEAGGQGEGSRGSSSPWINPLFFKLGRFVSCSCVLEPNFLSSPRLKSGARLPSCRGLKTLSPCPLPPAPCLFGEKSEVAKDNLLVIYFTISLKYAWHWTLSEYVVNANAAGDEAIVMTQAAIRPRMSFEEYIDLCAQTDEHYELVRGELKLRNPPTWLHIKIAKLLEQVFDAECERMGYPWEAFRDSGQRTESDSSRKPDVLVAPVDVILPKINQTAVLTVAAPVVVEIVSPSSATEDYSDKLQEYQTLGISEYWVVDHEGLGAARVHWISFSSYGHGLSTDG